MAVMDIYADEGIRRTYRIGNLRPVLRAVRVPGFLIGHDCRHFYASGLIAEGCDVVTVQRALGHSSATTTLNTYSHLWSTAEDSSLAKDRG